MVSRGMKDNIGIKGVMVEKVEPDREVETSRN